MIYNQVAPLPLLKDFIRCYWWLDNSINRQLEYTILPDGCFDLILYFQNYKLERIVLTGLYAEKIDVQIAPDTQLLGIQFRLLAVDYLIQQHIAPFFNNEKILPLNFWDLKSLSFKNQLATVQFLNQKCANIIKTQKKIDLRKVYLFQLLYQTKGSHSIATYAEQVHWSPRQMNRYFKKRFGLSLKSYCNILKCIASFKHIKKGQLAPEYNYFDQSHFIKDLKKYTGNRPKDLFKNENDRFLQLSIIANE